MMRAIGRIGWAVLLTAALAAAAQGAARVTCHQPIPGSGGLLAFGEFDAKAFAWNKFVLHLDPKAGLARPIEAYRKKNGLPVNLWPPKDLNRLPPGLSRLEDHEAPCGTEVTVFTRSLDPKGLPWSGLLDTERIVEIDPQGRVLGRWGVPANGAGVAAVRGSTILVRSWAGTLCGTEIGEPRADHDIWLVIAADGSFSVVDPDPKIAQPERAQCRLPEHFAKSAYAGCWRFKDLDSGAVRILVFDAPCT